MQIPIIIHVEVTRKGWQAVCYYILNNVVHSLEASSKDFSDMYNDVFACNADKAQEHDWINLIQRLGGEIDGAYMDFIVDNPELAPKFKPYMGDAEIKELNHYLHAA